MIALASKIINALFSQADISQILLGIIAFSYYSLVLQLIPPPPPYSAICRIVHMPFLVFMTLCIIPMPPQSLDRFRRLTYSRCGLLHWDLYQDVFFPSIKQNPYLWLNIPNFIRVNRPNLLERTHGNIVTTNQAVSYSKNKHGRLELNEWKNSNDRR